MAAALDQGAHRIVIRGAGGPEVLSFERCAVPQPRRKQVRIRVAAAGVAYGDVMRRRGLLAPRGAFTPGYDVAGTVDAVGSGVDPALVGKRVAALLPRTGIGGYASHVCVPARRLVTVPDEVEPAVAVALGLNYITARQMLRLARLQRGQRLLLHGASGGVGTAVLDLARALDLEVYGTASARKHETVRARGGIPIDYRSEDFVARLAELCPEGVDAVFDGIGGDNLMRSYRVLGPRGALVWFGLSGVIAEGWRGMLGGAWRFLRLKLRLDRRRVCFYGITVSPGASHAQCVRDWQGLLEDYQAGGFEPLIGARLPLEQAAEAHALIDAGTLTGKIVLEV